MQSRKRKRWSKGSRRYTWNTWEFRWFIFIGRNCVLCFRCHWKYAKENDYHNKLLLWIRGSNAIPIRRTSCIENRKFSVFFFLANLCLWRNESKKAPLSSACNASTMHRKYITHNPVRLRFHLYHESMLSTTMFTHIERYTCAVRSQTEHSCVPFIVSSVQRTFYGSGEQTHIVTVPSYVFRWRRWHWTIAWQISARQIIIFHWKFILADSIFSQDACSPASSLIL